MKMVEAEKVYNKLAKIYDKLRMKGKRFNDLLEMPAVFSMLGNVKRKKILDVGCGSGIYCKILAKKGAKVFGIDISSKMLELAEKRCKNLNIEFKKGGIAKLPYESNSFDIVIANLVIHYLKNPNKAFKEFYRVLKKNGILIFSTNHPTAEAFDEFIKYKGKNAGIIFNYFKKGKFYWKIREAPKIKIPAYYSSFEDLLKLIIKNKFRLLDLKETKFPNWYKRKPIKHHKKFFDKPTFIVFKAKKE